MDTGKEAIIASQVCERFFPQIFKVEQEEDKSSSSARFRQLKEDFNKLREEAGDQFFEFYNRIER